jgi:hypothetical protein
MRTHAVNVTHLVLGLVFLGIAGTWALSAGGVVDLEARWLLPMVLVLAGAAGLVAAMARTARRRPGPSEADPPL